MIWLIPLASAKATLSGTISAMDQWLIPVGWYRI